MRILTAFALALLLPAAAVADPRAFALPGGIPTPVPGTDITLQLNAVQDTRCPPAVRCVWEGAYVADISILSGGGDTTTVTLSNALHNGRAIVTLGDHTITLVHLTPDRTTLAALGRPVQITDYMLELTVAP